VTSPDVLETVPPVDALPGRRARPALAVLIVVVVVAGLVGLRWSQRPTGWVTQQTYYSEKQKVAVPGLDVCVQVELTGMMKYERSAAAERPTGTSDTLWSTTRRSKRSTTSRVPGAPT